MIERIAGMRFFLLQRGLPTFKDDNPMEGWIFLIVIAGVVFLAVIYHIVATKLGRSRTGRKSRSGASSGHRKFNAFNMMRISSNYGLDREQAKLLEYVFITNGVSDIDRTIKNPVLVDRHFKRAFKYIAKNSANEEEAQQSMAKLFTLRNLLDVPPEADDAPSVQISENTPAILACGEDSYPVKVLSSKGQNMLTEIPINKLGTPIRFSNGTGITLSFPDNGFSFDGRIVGVESINQEQGLQITHTGRAKALVKRKYRRRQTSIECAFSQVKVEEEGSGKKKTSKLVVDNKSFSGTLQDVSIGGCSLKTRVPIQAGTRLKISTDYEDNLVIKVLGQILRVNRSGSAGTIMHVKFLKVPRRSFNSINTLIFGYNE